MERLSLRFVAGRLWRIEARARDGLLAGRASGLARIWPGRFAWLVRLAGWQAAGFGSQLRAVLETPEMVALLEACPQAGRMLKPICRMLAVETTLLRQRAAVARVRERLASPVVACTGAVVARRIGQVEEPWRIPLPRGVLAAARRQGFGRRVVLKG
jgi:hypothetical protein